MFGATGFLLCCENRYRDLFQCTVGHRYHLWGQLTSNCKYVSFNNWWRKVVPVSSLLLQITFQLSLSKNNNQDRKDVSICLWTPPSETTGIPTLSFYTPLTKCLNHYLWAFPSDSLRQLSWLIVNSDNAYSLLFSSLASNPVDIPTPSIPDGTAVSHQFPLCFNSFKFIFRRFGILP